MSGEAVASFSARFVKGGPTFQCGQANLNDSKRVGLTRTLPLSVPTIIPLMVEPSVKVTSMLSRSVLSNGLKRDSKQHHYHQTPTNLSPMHHNLQDALLYLASYQQRISHNHQAS